MKAKSLKELAIDYGISLKTLKKWLDKVEGIPNLKGRRILTPNELEKIFNHLGRP